jgi:ubiquinone/menaquinone biosynthesis C-methylase UbiE
MKAKYDTIGINYNETRKADPYIAERLFENLNPKADGLFLDIGCGTGNYTNNLQKRRINFISVDPSKNMLNKAKHKNPNVDWKLGHAQNTGLPSESINGIMASLTIHHWDNLETGFRELYRVLKPNGKLVVFTSTPKQMKGYWLNHYFPKMLEASIL